MTEKQNHDRLDALIVRHMERMPDPDEAAIARVLDRLPRFLPRQKGWLLGRLPTILLDWNFAPAWPRMAALATCAVVGFLVGMAGIDGYLEGADGLFPSALATDFPALALEPDPFSDLDL